MPCISFPIFIDNDDIHYLAQLGPFKLLNTSGTSVSSGWRQTAYFSSVMHVRRRQVSVISETSQYHPAGRRHAVGVSNVNATTQQGQGGTGDLFESPPGGRSHRSH